MLVTFLFNLLPAGTAATRATRHFDLLCNPVNLRVVLLKPGVSQDQILLSEACYCELDPFRMILVAEDDIHYFPDGSCLVQSPVNIVHWDRSAKGPCGDPIPIHKASIYEKASGSTVEESHEGYELLSVRGDYLYLEVERVLRRGGGDHVPARKSLFPSLQAGRVDRV